MEKVKDVRAKKEEGGAKKARKNSLKRHGWGWKEK